MENLKVKTNYGLLMELSIADLLAVQTNMNYFIERRRSNGHSKESLDMFYLIRDDLRNEIDRRYKAIFGVEDLFKHTPEKV